LTHSIGPGTKDVLEVCETVELACAELYHYFGEIFKEDREIFLLWLKTAMEEENHARLFALVRKLRRNNIVESIQVELVEAEVTLLYVRSLIKKVKKHPPSLEEALRMAIDLEIKLNGFLLENVVSFTDQSYERSFLGITNSDSRHLEALQEAYANILARA
jgi:rubrerythrin